MRFSAKILAGILLFVGYQSFSQNSINLDGFSQYLSVPSSPDIALDSGFTIEAWVYPTSVDGNNVVLSKSTTSAGPYGYMIFLDTLNQRITARVGDAAFEVSADSSWQLFEWTHIAVTHNSSDLLLYVNGAQVGVTSAPPNLLVNADSLIIGNVSGTGFGDFFQGDIDEVRISHQALPGDLLGAHMFDTSVGVGLVTYFNFDEGVGATAGDTGAGGTTDPASLINGVTWTSNTAIPTSIPNPITVTNGNDAGTASLREAMALANVYPFSDTVTIQLLTGDSLFFSSDLPRLINTPKRIDGAKVIIDGGGLPIFRNANYLEVRNLGLTNSSNAIINDGGGSAELWLVESSIDGCFSSEGSAVNNAQFDQANIIASSITNNSGSSAIWNNGSMYIENSTIAINGTFGFVNHYQGSHTIVNSTFANNANAGVVIDSSAVGSSLYNNILFGNGVDDIQIHDNTAPSDHQFNFVGLCAGTCPGGYDGSDPKLGSLQSCDGLVLYYDLQEGSPAIDPPNAASPPSEDACFNPRDDGFPDAGASEYSSPGPGPSGSDYDVFSIAFGYESLASPDTLLLGDEQLSDTIPIGFGFQFFGNSYSTLFISSNGYITFQPDSTDLSQNIPDPAVPNNLIAGFWADLDPSQGGFILYDTVGSAPTRRFVVEYQSVPHFSSGADSVDFQIILYENSNDIEIHCLECSGPVAETHTQGLENDFGDKAAFLAGRVETDFAASFEAVQFVPSAGPGPGSSSYLITQPTFFYETLGAPTTVFLANDSLSGAVPIGFDFDFFGTLYDSIYISSNGYLTFIEDTVTNVVHGIPDIAAPNALIAGFWGDLNPMLGGSIFYETVGVSPSRVFVVEYQDILHTSGSDTVNMQIQLFEDSNDIEVHCQSCPSPSSEPHTQGVENEFGVQGVSPDGRSASEFSLFGEATGFTPFVGGEGDGPVTFVPIESFDFGLPPVFSNGVFELTLGDWEIKNVREDTLFAFEGNAAARIDHTSALSELISPPLSGDSAVSFYFALPGPGTFGFEVLSSVDGAPFSAVEYTDVATSSAYKKAAFALSYPGSEVRLKIKADAGVNDQDLLIDDFEAVFLEPIIGIIEPTSYDQIPQLATGKIQWFEFNIDPADIIVVEISGDGGNTFQTIVQDTSYLLNQQYQWFVDSTLYAVTDEAFLQIRTLDNAVSSGPLPIAVLPPDFGTGEYDVSIVPFSFETLPAPGSLSLTDDEMSGPVSMPFDFHFYGAPYSQVYISSNGFLSFLPGQGPGCCGGYYMPDSELPNGLVAGYWGDLDPSSPSSGLIYYETLGSSPNRVFVVHYDSIIHVDGSAYADFQIKLFEGSNEIEVHCQNCEDDGYEHTQGIEDATGSRASYFAGRNPGFFPTTNEGIRFLPAPTKFDTLDINGVTHIVITDRGQGVGDVTFTNDKVYVLQGRVFVNPGQLLTIQPGTVIKGSEGHGPDAGVLIVSRDAMINASGTETSPIIFTSELDDLLPPISGANLEGSSLQMIDAGLWGGVYLLGNAPITNLANEDSLTVEGFPMGDMRSVFGGFNGSDSSGVFKYVSIRHAGAEIDPGVESNALFLAGVGNGTEVNHVEIYSALDDGLEIYGGAVDVSDVLINTSFDDALDITGGFTGSVYNFQINALGTDHALEIDGPEGSLDPFASFFLSKGTVRGFGGEMADFRTNAQAYVDSLYFYNFEDPLIAGAGDLELGDDSTSQNYFDTDLFFADFQFTLAPGVNLGDVIFDNSIIQASNIVGDTVNFATQVALGSNTVGADTTVFTGWTLTNFDPAPSIQIATRQSENEEIPPGANEFYLYEFKWDVLFGDVTSENFFLGLEGTYAASDFASTDPFKLYYSVDVDDPDSATFFSATGFGDGISLGTNEFEFDFNQTVTEGSQVFFYVKASLDSAATLGNEFRVAQPSVSDFTLTAPAVASGLEMTEGSGYRIGQFSHAIEFDTVVISGVTHIVITDHGQGLGDYTMVNDIVYVLNGRVLVNPGATLTIEPGTIIKGTTPGDDVGGLIVARGAMLNAAGTATEPIIFTSEQDNILPPVGPMNLQGSSLELNAVARWGGIAILGDAPISDFGDFGEALLEGAPSDEDRAYFGGVTSADNSGTLQYVSIRHGGFEFEGLLLAGVGSGTTVDHIEIVGMSDDGLEILGGTVNVQSILVNGAQDDGIDIDMGYAGTVSNFRIHAPSPSDHALEIDGPEGSLQASFTIQNGVIEGSNGEIADFRDNAQGALSNVYSFDFEDPQIVGQGDIELADDSTSIRYFNDELTFSSLEFTYGAVVPDSVIAIDNSIVQLSNVSSEVGIFGSQVAFGSQTVGLTDSTAFDGWTITDFAPAPTALLGTAPVLGDSVAAGTADLPFYSMVLEARFGSINVDSVIFEIGGTYDFNDFGSTPFDLRYSLGIDDFGAAISLGDQGFGGGVPLPTNQVAWSVGQTVPDNSKMYLYLTADLDSLATGGNTFNVVLPDTANFFLTGSPSKVSVSLLSGESFIIDQVDITPPVVTVDTLYASSTSPALSGTVDDIGASVSITVNGTNYSATVNVDNTWNLAGGVIAPALAEGAYDVLATATDAFGNSSSDSTTNELTVDLTTPIVAIDTLLTTDSTPPLSGTVDDSTAVVSIQIDTLTYQAVNQGDGTWTIADSTISSLAEGIYDLIASATDKAGNIGTDSTTNELTIDFGAPNIGFDTLSTTARSPALSGTVDDSTAVVKLVLLDSTYQTVNNGDGTWSLAAGTIDSLAVGEYDIVLNATDNANNLAVDTTFNGLRILPAAPVANPGAEVTVSSFVASWSNVGADVTGYFIDVSRNETFTSLLDGYDGLAVGATSMAVSGLDYSSTYYYRVKAAFNSGDISTYSETIAVQTITDPGTAADSLALVNIFETLGGDEWTENSNWLVGRLRDWYGVEFSEARVRAVVLDTNNLVGVWPAVLEGLDQMTLLSLKGNEITELTDISGMASLSKLNVAENRLQFGTLERLVSQVDSVDYSPQKEVLQRVRTLREVGTSYVVRRQMSGSANTYSWFKDEEAITHTADTLLVEITSTSDEGSFHVEVTNQNVPGLTLKSRPVLLRVSSLERDRAALLAIYEATGGAEWTNGADWPNQDDILLWEGVGVLDNRVTSLDLSSSNVVGDMPDDILDIPGLLALDLSNNKITALPDLTDLTSLTNPDVSGNLLQFDDLEPNADIPGINYSNQGRFGPEGVVAKIPKGADRRLAAPVGGTTNEYTWTFNGKEQTGVVVDTTRSSFTIRNINYDNQGQYVLTVENPNVPGLTLTSRPQTVYATVDIGFIPIYTDIDLQPAPLDEGEAYLLQIVAPNKPFDSTQQVTIDASGLNFPQVILGDYLIAIRTDSLILKDKDGRVDSVKLLPTYYRSTFLWEEADTLVLRGEIDGDSLFMQQRPRPLTPDDGSGEVGLLVESNFADVAGRGSRVQARRKVKRAGCSLRRRRRATGGRIENEEYELVAYKETDDDGRVTFNNLPDGTYRLNIEYPGIPMDTTSFLEFEIGAGGLEDNALTLEATVDEEGIGVELVEALGFLRKYFKDLEIYPNPADKHINVRYKKLGSEGVKVQLLSIYGQVMLEKDLAKGQDRNTVLDVEGIDEGIYLLRFYDPSAKSDNILTYRVVIRR